FPLLHIASGWDFQAVLSHRDAVVAAHGLKLIVRGVPAAEAANPFDASPAAYARTMLTAPLRAALDEFGIDAAISGGRRDEEMSRAKERIFSRRAEGHVWEPRRQRPEFWANYNTRLAPGETMRVFPLSNWTELDVWRYIDAEKIEIPPLYLAAERPVVTRDGVLIMIDDDRAKNWLSQTPQLRRVRFRTLGCWPLTSAVPSDAATVSAVIDEIAASRRSERMGRLVDAAGGGSMENKKREGYF
ncbi:MAG: sulfate adenylyltransferase subunit CysD, partial [Elsteraceae bacterium]